MYTDAGVSPEAVNAKSVLGVTPGVAATPSTSVKVTDSSQALEVSSAQVIAAVKARLSVGPADSSQEIVSSVSERVVSIICTGAVQTENV